MERAPQARLLTIDDLYSLPDDGQRYELLAGCLISEPVPGARHGTVVAAIVELLRSHVRRGRQGGVFTGDAGFILARCPDTLRGPDVSFVSQARFGSAGDVVSPSDRTREVLGKAPTTSPQGVASSGS